MGWPIGHLGDRPNGLSFSYLARTDLTSLHNRGKGWHSTFRCEWYRTLCTSVIAIWPSVVPSLDVDVSVQLDHISGCACIPSVGQSDEFDGPSPPQAP